MLKWTILSPEIDKVIFSPPILGEWKTDMTMPKNKFMSNSEKHIDTKLVIAIVGNRM